MEIGLGFEQFLHEVGFLGIKAVAFVLRRYHTNYGGVGGKNLHFNGCAECFAMENEFVCYGLIRKGIFIDKFPAAQVS